jgi:hypothetical protein
MHRAVLITAALPYVSGCNDPRIRLYRNAAKVSGFFSTDAHHSQNELSSAMYVL